MIEPAIDMGNSSVGSPDTEKGSAGAEPAQNKKEEPLREKYRPFPEPETPLVGRAIEEINRPQVNVEKQAPEVKGQQPKSFERQAEGPPQSESQQDKRPSVPEAAAKAEPGGAQKDQPLLETQLAEGVGPRPEISPETLVATEATLVRKRNRELAT